MCPTREPWGYSSGLFNEMEVARLGNCCNDTSSLPEGTSRAIDVSGGEKATSRESDRLCLRQLSRAWSTLRGPVPPSCNDDLPGQKQDRM